MEISKIYPAHPMIYKMLIVLEIHVGNDWDICFEVLNKLLIPVVIEIIFNWIIPLALMLACHFK